MCEKAAPWDAPRRKGADARVRSLGIAMWMYPTSRAQLRMGKGRRAQGVAIAPGASAHKGYNLPARACGPKSGILARQAYVHAWRGPWRPARCKRLAHRGDTGLCALLRISSAREQEKDQGPCVPLHASSADANRRGINQRMRLPPAERLPRAPSVCGHGGTHPSACASGACAYVRGVPICRPCVRGHI